MQKTEAGGVPCCGELLSSYREFRIDLENMKLQNENIQLHFLVLNFFFREKTLKTGGFGPKNKTGAECNEIF